MRYLSVPRDTKVNRYIRTNCVPRDAKTVFMAQQKKTTEKKKARIYSTKIIDEIMEDRKRGFIGDTDPFFEGEVEFRAANILFQLTDEEKAEWEKCAIDPIYFIEKYARFMTDRGRRTVVLREYQKKFIHLIGDEIWDDDLDISLPKSRNCISMMSRQLGKTTTVSAYFAWYMCFHNDRNLAVVANKEKTAKEIVSKMIDVFKGLPFFLRPGVINKSKTALKLDNGCYMYCAATSKTPATGDTIHVMYIDEAALIPNNIMDDFWASVYPTLSSSNVSQIILTSTPRGRQNLFFRLWDGSMKGFNSFNHLRVDWWEHPDHDEAWAEEQRRNFTPELFAQEFELQFDVDASKLVRGSDFKFMERIKKEFVNRDIPFMPKKLCDHTYWHPDFDPTSIFTDVINSRFLIVLDTAEGKEEGTAGRTDSDYNIINIFKVELMNPRNIQRFAIDRKIKIEDCFRFRQVGVYMDNDNDENEMVKALKYIVYDLFHAGSGPIDNVRVLIEMNFNGSNVLNKFIDHYNWYEALVPKTHWVKPVPGQVTRKKFGFKMTGGSRGKAYYCELGAKMISKKQIIVTQFHKKDEMCTIAELNAFGKVKKGQGYTYEGIALHDDLAITVLNVSRAVEMEDVTIWLQDYFDHLPNDRRKLGVARLLQIASQAAAEEGNSEGMFDALYRQPQNPPTPGYPQNTMGGYQNPYIGMGQKTNPYLGKSTTNPYIGRGVTNPYTGRGVSNPYIGRKR